MVLSGNGDHVLVSERVSGCSRKEQRDFTRDSREALSRLKAVRLGSWRVVPEAKKKKNKLNPPSGALCGRLPTPLLFPDSDPFPVPVTLMVRPGLWWLLGLLSALNILKCGQL